MRPIVLNIRYLQFSIRKVKTMTAFDLVRVIFFFCLAAAVSSVSQLSSTYTELHNDQIPVAGVTQLSTFVTNSPIDCTQKCWITGYSNSSCEGVIYQARSCADHNSKPYDMGGVCQLVRCPDATSLAFAPTNSSCQKFYSPRVNCAIELQSFSYTSGNALCKGSTFNDQSGFVKLNGITSASINFCEASGLGSTVRGVTLLTIDPTSCSAITSRRYNTGVSTSESSDLANDLMSPNNGTLFVAVTGDEPQNYLSPAFSALNTTCNVDIESLVFRGSFAFVCEIGFPSITKWQLASPSPPFARFNATVNGTILGKRLVIS